MLGWTLFDWFWPINMLLHSIQPKSSQPVTVTHLNFARPFRAALLCPEARPEPRKRGPAAFPLEHCTFARAQGRLFASACPPPPLATLLPRVGIFFPPKRILALFGILSSSSLLLAKGKSLPSPSLPVLPFFFVFFLSLSFYCEAWSRSWWL